MSGLLCGKMDNSKVVMFWDPYCFNTTSEFKESLRKTPCPNSSWRVSSS